ncbi:hypothetical protein H206_00744 [Candidatus Electrothrix aarhusensis]|uniref:Tetratricopeptide repeat-containing protein n=1 Tax=Candidatus Electrothrix aarhusensis TaxID=1859131 RepID=A0A444IY94_9BACT|nr:hypothetical protein H206_00744 [Candidatus Electrothrix aarhusensis]
MRPYNLLRFLLFFGLIALMLYQLRVALIAQTAYSNIAVNKTIKEYQSEPRLLVEYSKENILQGDHENARKWLKKALQANPVYIPAWLTLAELENDSGNTARSLEILEYLDRLMEGVLRWRWEKAMLAYLLGREDIFKADLSWLLQQENLSRPTQKKVLDFAFSLWPEPVELLQEMGKKNSVPLFLHALRIKNRETAEFLWAEVDHTQLEKRQILTYINLLINNQKINEAALLWKEYYPADNLLYNGSFSIPPVKGGFGWRIWPPEGVEVEVQKQDVAKMALHIHFNGEQNIHFHQTRQTISLPSGQNFILKGEMRSKGLTTDQRPFIEVAGRDCSLQSATTEMAEPDQDWTPFSLNFTLPEDCHQGVEVRVRRLPSKKIDSLISGDLWVTNLSLQNAPSPTLQ